MYFFYLNHTFSRDIVCHVVQEGYTFNSLHEMSQCLFEQKPVRLQFNYRKMKDELF